MRKKKKEKEGPRGMVKRCMGKGKAGPAKPPPDMGDVVWYMDRRGMWRTGELIRIVDRGKSWGRCEVRDSVSRQIVKNIEPEHVRSI